MIKLFANRVRQVGTVSLLPVAFLLSVNAEAAAPRISGTPATSMTVGQTYNFVPKATDADGNKLTFSIANKPGFASFSASTGQLSGVPFAEHARLWSGIVITVSDGTSKVSLPAFSLNVKPSANKSPTITGTPATTATVGKAYSYTPTAKDPEGKTLSFAILNKPTWATFDRGTGKLSGTPTAAGTFSSIVIYVTDGATSAAQPSFSIKVAAATATATNAAPTISGSPVTSAKVGVPYSFKPLAADANKDLLTFSVTNMPGWAKFNTATGELSGTPNLDGTYANIQIKVSDGKATAALNAFSLAVEPAGSRTVSISWVPPTTYEDGSALTNLAGYRVHYGTSPTNLSATMTISSAGITRQVMDSLASGTWYFALTAYTTDGTESVQSAVISASVM